MCATVCYRQPPEHSRPTRSTIALGHFRLRLTSDKFIANNYTHQNASHEAQTCNAMAYAANEEGCRVPMLPHAFDILGI